MKKDFENLTNEEYMEISDFSLVSALVGCLGFSIVKTTADPSEYPKVRFVFRKTKELEDAIANFWDGSLRVDPKRYWSATREIKSQIRNK